MKKYEFNENELTKKAFQVYSNSSFTFWKDGNTFSYSDNPNSERIKVSLPENKYFKIYETATGELAVESSWSWNYSINEVLQGNKVPCFFALDKNQDGHRVYLDICE